MTDPEILSRSFKLSDAQELVARQHGFESWQALKTGLSTMPDHAGANSPRAVITAAEPELFVADIRASCDFFADKLGFTIAFTYGKPPFYAQVMRDAARLNLKCVERPVIDPALRDREQLLSAALTVATAMEIKAALSRVSGRRRDVFPDAQTGALGREEFYRPGYRREFAAVRRTGGVASASLRAQAKQSTCSLAQTLRVCRRR
jgi:catechol 2,3-dioxygenase-like lactoylglutathione lyase family enzyme